MQIHSTIGDCGNNKPEEVLWFREMLSKTCYQELTGRDVKGTGKCSRDMTAFVGLYETCGE